MILLGRLKTKLFLLEEKQTKYIILIKKVCSHLVLYQTRSIKLRDHLSKSKLQGFQKKRVEQQVLRFSCILLHWNLIITCLLIALLISCHNYLFDMARNMDTPGKKKWFLFMEVPWSKNFSIVHLYGMVRYKKGSLRLTK